MITNVKLTPASFAHPDRDTRAVVTNSDWISNGHWLIQRDNVVNQMYVNAEDYKDQFRKSPPMMPAAEAESRFDFWEMIAFDATDLFFVTRWVYNLGEYSLRLLASDYSSSLTNPESDPSIDSYCLVIDEYIRSLGLEYGDLLEGLAKTRDVDNAVYYLLRSDDLTRCVTSCSWIDSADILNAQMDLEQMADMERLLFNPHARASVGNSANSAKAGSTKSAIRLPTDSLSPNRRGPKSFVPSASRILDILGRR